jgi:hypothetical protein
METPASTVATATTTATTTKKEKVPEPSGFHISSDMVQSMLNSRNPSERMPEKPKKEKVAEKIERMPAEKPSESNGNNGNGNGFHISSDMVQNMLNSRNTFPFKK